MKVTKSFEFSGAHRLYNYQGNCHNIHGHEYKVEVTFEGSQDALGIIIDFRVIKDKCQTWVDENWDHAYIYHPEDEVGTYLTNKGFRTFDMGANPTAENMSRFLFDQFFYITEEESAKLVNVRVYETPTSWADFELADWNA
jgi:6-pyruvoyltetrahydropterin/6-carboxytetrahydropterin synthase